MKKISTLFIGLLFVSLNLNAQNTTCLDAQVITESGTFTVSTFTSGQYPPNSNCTSSSGALWGARWYLYQSMIDGLATVTSDLTTNGNVDTRLTIYSGNCEPLANLTCLAGNDDIDTPNNKFSEVSFAVSSGSSYYIVWDNANYGPPNPHPAFDFSLTETAIDCSAISLPIYEDFDDYNTFVACLTTENADNNFANFEQNSFDWDGDSIAEDYAENGSTSINEKNDWLFSTPINLITGHDYTITFKYNGANGTFNANENLYVDFMDGPSSGATSLINLFSATGIEKNGSFEEAESMATNQSIDYTSTATGIYYLAFNATSPANTGSLLLFEYSITDNTLGVSDFTRNGLSKSYNKQTDVLTLDSSNMVLGGIEIYNILGQEVYNKSLSKQEERINLSGLFDGIYIVRVSSAGQTYTTKLLKQ